MPEERKSRVSFKNLAVNRLLHQRGIERIGAAAVVIGIGLGDVESGVIVDAPLGHARQDGIGNLVAQRAVLDGIGADVDGIGNVARVAGMDGQRQILRMGFVRHGAGEQEVEAVVEHAVAPSRFEDGFNAIHARALQFVHLLARFLRRLRRADDLRGDGRADSLRHVAGEFGAVAAFRGEHGAANEELRAQFRAASRLQRAL